MKFRLRSIYKGGRVIYYGYAQFKEGIGGFVYITA